MEKIIKQSKFEKYETKDERSEQIRNAHSQMNEISIIANHENEWT